MVQLIELHHIFIIDYLCVLLHFLEVNIGDVVVAAVA